jgi:hypothetical protein
MLSNVRIAWNNHSIKKELQQHLMPEKNHSISHQHQNQSLMITNRSLMPTTANKLALKFDPIKLWVMRAC